MSRDMENHSFNERNSLGGNSGMLGLSSLKPNLQPIRIKEFMAMYGSDEEDSEDRGKDSSSDEDAEEVQQLPEDPEVPLTFEEEQYASVETATVQCLDTNDENESRSSEMKSESLDKSRTKETRHEFENPLVRSVSKNFTNNFCSEDSSMPKNKTQESQVLVSSQHERSARKPLACANRRSNIKLEIPDCSAPSTNDTPAMSVRREEIEEKPHYSRERNPLSDQSENHTINSSSLELAGSKPQGVMETPLKNNPPPGSMRPTPSTSHRSMFQTPQSSKIHQDYSKNHAQTPATIFGNWSQNHMAQTPHQAHYTTSESSRTQGHAYTPHSSANHEGSLAYRGNTEKRARKPLGETMQSSQYAQNDKLPCQYESSSSSSMPISKSYENHHRGVLETVIEKSTSKGPLSMKMEAKENRHPRTIDKSSIVEEPLRRTVSEGTNTKERAGENRFRAKLTFSSSNAQIYEQPEVNYPGNSIASTLFPQEKNKLSEKPGNAQIYERPESNRPHNSIMPNSIPQENNFPERSSNAQIYEQAENNRAHNSIVTNTQEKNNLPQKSNNENIYEQTENDRARNSTLSNAQEQNHLPERPNNAKIYEQAEDNRPRNSNVPSSKSQEKSNLPERPNNVQVSIPSRMRRPNQGQTIIVKGKEYVILGTLGEGMSGQVLRVQDISNLDLRAIKVVDLSRMDKDCAQGCLQEISMLHKLQAPCIIRMFDHEIKYPMVHVVMEIGDTDFKSLLNSMSEKKRLPLTMILYYWTEMLTAVKHIHDNGVIHSDLKPANFLLVRGRLKLIDFGIASSMNADMTSVVKNNPIGTLNYISPEALMDIGGNGGDSPNRTVKYKISFKSDVWSLGCILYSLVYGYTPFHNFRTQWAKVSAITNPNPKISFAQPTGQDVEAIPTILIDVMRKCLQHDPKARPTVAQLLQIPYIPVKPSTLTPVPDIPPNILMKIKYSLTDDEWRQFTEIMAARRNQ